MGIGRKTLFVVIVCLVVLLLAASVAMAGTPKRVLIVVMDQMRPEYAQQYDMTNVLKLQDLGVWFPNAYVGDMASETVVSHNVMVSGRFPGHMGWSDEAMRDVYGALGTDKSAIWAPGDLGYAQFVSLIASMGDYPKLGDYLHEAFPDTIVANVGQKGYQVESMAASSSDIYVRMGSSKAANPTLTGLPGKYRGPSGMCPQDPTKPPSYITSDPRFFISSGNPADPATAPPDSPDRPDTYGTTVTEPAWIYPEDGRYAPGPYAGHESGDAWVADAAMKIMENEDWSGLWVTFSAIDKIGHMWGAGGVDNIEKYGWTPGSLAEQIHLPWAAKNADDQLGRLLAKLEELGQLDDTLIVLTADHGSTAGTKYFGGVNAKGAGDNNWYYGTSMDGIVGTGSPAMKALIDTGNVKFSYQSTAMEAWLTNQSYPKKVQAAKAMSTLTGIIATYIRSDDGRKYTLFSAKVPQMTASERSWWQQHGQELVNTMAWKGAADVVGLMADGVTYGAFGDHGGAQKSVQKIPMAIYMPGIQHTVNTAGMRLVDIMPTILKALGVPLTAPVDGRAYSLPISAD